MPLVLLKLVATAAQIYWEWPGDEASMNALGSELLMEVTC